MTDPIDAKLERIRRSLLDLTRRNRLLNFGKGKGRSSLRIVDELPEQIFQSLVVDGKTMQFLSREEAKEGAVLDAEASLESPPEENRASESGPIDLDEGAVWGEIVHDASGDGLSDDAATEIVEVTESVDRPESVEPGLEEEFTEGAELAEGLSLAAMESPTEAAQRHTDLNLQTDHAGEKLQSALVHLAREARSALDERGSNILFLTLGIVEWVEPTQPDVISRAPLLFIPVELQRKNVNRRYRVTMFDADVVTNPSLLELCRRSLGMELPAVDLEQEFDVTRYFAAVEESLATIPGWSLAGEIHLALFSFAKLLLYQDLDPDRWPEERDLRKHPLIRVLAGVSDELPREGELPNPETLDDEIAPEESFQVVSADSSQLAAVVAAKRGANLVIQGPPGTGKSQTITNIVAECLAAGRTVLFVAEKAAALEVVKRRLDHVGLGDVVLDLHSRTASRRVVLEELRRSLDAEPDLLPDGVDGRELTRTRRDLNAYVRELHAPVGGLEISPFEAMERALQTKSSPEAVFEIPGFFETSADELDELEENIRSLDRTLGRIGDPSRHPFRGSRLEQSGLEVRQRIEAKGDVTRTTLHELVDLVRASAERIGVEPPTDAVGVRQMVVATEALLHASASCGETIADSRFDAIDPGLRRWMQTGCDRQAAVERWSASMIAEAEDVDWSSTLERRRVDGESIIRFLKPSWHRDNRRVKAYRKEGIELGLKEEIEVLQRLVASAGLREELRRGEAEHATSFGNAYDGLDSDFRSLLHLAETTVELRRRIREGELGEGAARALLESSSRREPTERIERVTARLELWITQLREFLDVVRAAVSTEAHLEPSDSILEPRFFAAPIEATPFDEVDARLDAVIRELPRLQDWVDYWVSLSACRVGEKSASIRPFVEFAVQPSSHGFVGKLDEMFRRQFYHLYADRALEGAPALRRFRGEDHDARVERFRGADREWIELSRVRLRKLLIQRRPDYSHAAGPTSKLGILKHEMRKKRRHMPLRKLFDLVGGVVQGVKPCFMMSPASVAQYLSPSGLRFDVAIFDEASQVEPADALGAIARADQVLLIGDENQLPPTDFFGRIDDESPLEEDDVGGATELESVLGLGAVRFPRDRQCSLRWHYRSLHPSLIEFSNSRFYDDKLRIFPSPHADRSRLGLVFEHVHDGVYLRGKGVNPIEARRVAEAALRHAVEQPQYSLGVGAFSQSQQRAIEDQVELLRRQSTDPRVEAFFARDAEEPFFVKNLETIQGDERDVIFLSVGYGPDKYGKVSMNLGPLNRDGGWRRLNVLVTRSRRRCVLFSSMRSDAIRLDATDAEGVRALKEYLATAELGADVETPRAGGGFQSPFEEGVRDALVERGYSVHSQVGVAGFHIDLAIVDPENAGVYLLGIECDGAVYHSSPTARDRDRIREEVLVGRGWVIERIWSTDWYRRQEAVVDALVSRVEQVRNDRAARGVEPAPLSPPPAAMVDGGDAADERTDASDAELSDAGESTERDVESSEDTPDGVTRYRRAPVTIRGDFDELVGSPPERLGGELAELVEVEGPIHRDEAQRVVFSWYEARSTSNSRASFEEGLRSGVERGLYRLVGDFLWSVESERQEATIRRRDGDDAVTDPDHIPDEEYDALVVWVAAKELGSRRDDLARSAARILGFPRTTPRLTTRIDEAIARLLAHEKLVVDGQGFVGPP